MRTALRLSALAVAVVCLALWFFGGMNRGWTKTSVAVEHIDPVTEQRGVVWERRFLPGVEFLAGGALLSVLLWACSFLARKSDPPAGTSGA
jgi:hypothetical protein